MATLTDALEAWLPAAQRRIGRLPLAPRFDQIGRVQRVGDGIAILSGLPDARVDELVLFPNGVPGLAVDLAEDTIGCILLGGDTGIAAGDPVRGTGAVVRVPVGEALLGRIVDPLGRPLDDGPAIAADRFDPVEQEAPAIIERALVTQPVQTGITVLDAMFPLGRGQRELILGDRSTGKTALALDTIINQRDSDMICLYVAVGQRSSSVRQVIEAVRTYGAFARCVFVIAEAAAAPGLLWLAPYAGFAMGEYFRDRGQHALVVVDDLTRHAATHRELALLLRQPPGREAYPGDIFHIHARLLERAARLNEERGGGSLTALPIAETQAGNLSAYIPTNLISITDGQIYLDAKLFHEGQKPAVDVGRSVSRVGGKTQAPALRGLAERLRLDYAQFLEIEVFTRFGGLVDERTRRRIEHGRRVRAVLMQEPLAPQPLGVQVALLLALAEGVLDRIPEEQVASFKQRLGPWFDAGPRAVLDRVESTGLLEADSRSALLDALAGLAATLAPAGTGPAP